MIVTIDWDVKAAPSLRPSSPASLSTTVTN